MAIFSDSITAPAAFAGAAAPSFTVPFVPNSICVINEDGTAANFVEVSFDGVAVAGKLIPTILAGLRFEQKVTKIWVRRGAGTPVVRIVAEI